MSPRSAWDRFQLARLQTRPKALDVLPMLFDDILELHGDQAFGDDAALVGGLAFFEGRPITFLAQSKGRNLDENLHSHFGMMHPEGYRKAQRLALQAEKFNRPIITLIDTAGAYPGLEAEQRGQASAIAQTLKLFSGLRVPIVALVLSEGGSGGALALGLADRVYMLENAVYSILSPEGFASILWKDETRAQEAAELMESTAQDLFKKGLIDGIVDEAPEGLHTDLNRSTVAMKELLRNDLNELCALKPERLLQQRYVKFRKMGATL
jgi:acetyl-CoA carboxylase carboxyl transferase subunit alpha